MTPGRCSPLGGTAYSRFLSFDGEWDCGTAGTEGGRGKSKNE